MKYNKGYTLGQLRAMSTEKLFEISLRRYPKNHRGKGRYTQDALKAQQVYAERKGGPIMAGANHWRRDHTPVSKV